ncbi:MAG: ATP-binding protein [Synechococcales cyanobacterium CRU_2_2]|nr:ATP-binding protein [Synechococcales cyanobacterium CRU_2_2]
MKSSIVGDVATGCCYGLAILSCVFGRYIPEPAKTIALAAATGAATAQFFANSDEDSINQAIAQDAIRETQLRGLNDQMMDRQGLERSQAEILNQTLLLKAIAQAPKALQPLLLEQHGFGHIIPLLQESPQAAVATSSGLKQAQTWDEDESPTADYSWVDKVNGFPAVLVFGPQGSGKTTLAEFLVQRRHELGHEIEILDPHRAAGAWEGLTCYGAGMDYAAVDRRLLEFEETTKARYEVRSRKRNYKPQPRTLVAEEMTNWADRCDNAENFLKTCLSDNRKIGMHALFIAHGRELALLGGGKGTSKMRDNGLLEIQLFSEPGPDGRPRPTGKGQIRWPASKDWESIDIPDLSGFSLAITPTESPAEDFADESGISGELETGDRVDDAGDLINLRMRYQQAKIKPSGGTLVEWWNEVATVPLEPDSKTITGLLQICEMTDGEFERFLSETLGE